MEDHLVGVFKRIRKEDKEAERELHVLSVAIYVMWHLLLGLVWFVKRDRELEFNSTIPLRIAMHDLAVAYPYWCAVALFVVSTLVFVLVEKRVVKGRSFKLPVKLVLFVFVLFYFRFGMDILNVIFPFSA